MMAHKVRAHPEDQGDLSEMFRFKIEMKHKSAFARQLSEAVYMKNSPSVILNLKDEYSRCLVPDIPLGDRGWNDEGEQRSSAKTDREPLERTTAFEAKQIVRIPIRSTRCTKTVFKKTTKRKNKRIKY